jgi:hypothetical protein
MGADRRSSAAQSRDGKIDPIGSIYGIPRREAYAQRVECAGVGGSLEYGRIEQFRHHRQRRTQRRKEALALGRARVAPQMMQRGARLVSDGGRAPL